MDSNDCDSCGERLERVTIATSRCANCGCRFYVDSAGGRPIHRIDASLRIATMWSRPQPREGTECGDISVANEEVA